MDINNLMRNKKSWDEVASRFFGRNPLPEYGPMAPLEDELNLLGNVTNWKVLDIGCGSGHSLKYMDERQASELWGIDLSTKQLEAAAKTLSNSHAPVQLFESAMEVNPGLPNNYFDLVYSIYAIGWTTDLQKTFRNVHQYLKPGGIFVFSWEHPFYRLVSQKDNHFAMKISYHQEGPYDHISWQQPAIMQQYKISTYVNYLVETGFQIERLIEDIAISPEDLKRQENRWYSIAKANMIPPTFIIKCKKI
ncbi:class I SAM-dependent methyltransferase [Caldibacillus lycopersici]|uniref:Class I SAM-dependent methyltransferase n=1 Tax=Perspicuibacillus lycopersici TaxID=1325689 RepID=A0AAE3LN23_9BACI|nr:class I SAM-dependent methyltransferase [Perspicuibacillus lycopersici]MCU9613511.1 class I SAM-dependent methyltransferase [Perspicuibacillus lycopersici]